MMRQIVRLSLWMVALTSICLSPRHSLTASASPAATTSHSSNHAVIVSSSRYWFNYRHTTNALSIYQLLKRNGVPDENIVLMLADEYAINDRNVFKNKMLTKGRSSPSLYDEQTEIDYRADDVTVDNFIRVLLGRAHESSLPVLRSDQTSHVLVYLTGHGGDQFFKFQDVEEITSQQIAHAFRRMHDLRKYQELLLIADTCQAFTLADHMDIAPNVTVIASSLKGESSYAHHSDPDLGLSVTERYTAALVDYIAKPGNLQLSLRQGLVDPYPFAVQRAHIGFTDATSSRKLDEALVSDFFSSNVNTNMNESTNNIAEWVPLDDAVHRYAAPTISQSQKHAMRSSNRKETQTATTMAQVLATDAMPIESFFAGMEPGDPSFLTFAAVVVGTIAWVCR